MTCIVCGNPKVDQCHIRTKKNGGPDAEWNTYPGCRAHHSEQHRFGIVTFFKKYPSVREHLTAMGWELVELFGKESLWHKNLAIEKKGSCL